MLGDNWRLKCVTTVADKCSDAICVNKFEHRLRTGRTIVRFGNLLYFQLM